MSDIQNAMAISAMGMKVQGARIRVISENVANSATTGKTPGADPYVRQGITFKNEMDKNIGVKLIEVDEVTEDRSKPFPLEYKPDHPAADADGYVKMPNINSMIEVMDVREAQRSYEANLGMIDQSKSMLLRTVDMLK